MTAAFTSQDLADHTKLVGEFVLEQIDRVTLPLKQRIFELETRIAEIETRGVEYKGVYQRACGYKRGSMVTYDGSLWCAVTDVAPGTVPGQSNAWQLAVKSGAAPRLPTARRINGA